MEMDDRLHKEMKELNLSVARTRFMGFCGVEYIDIFFDLCATQPLFL